MVGYSNNGFWLYPLVYFWVGSGVCFNEMASGRFGLHGVVSTSNLVRTLKL